MFEGIDNIEVGMQFHADVSSGPGVVTVVSIEGDDITIDGNHPLAGVALNFDVEVIDVRLQLKKKPVMVYYWVLVVTTESYG